jgi:DNA polymerase-1
MPPLTTSTGIPTGAVKGVTNMLRNLRKENPDSYYLSVFDAKGKNFRHDIYKEYKANRPPMPEDLREQLSPLKKYVMQWECRLLKSQMLKLMM